MHRQFSSFGLVFTFHYVYIYIISPPYFPKSAVMVFTFHYVYIYM